MLARSLRRLAVHKSGLLGAGLVIAVVLPSLLAPLIEPDPYTVYPMQRLLPPSAEYLLGTDNQGRDVLGQVVWGGQAALLIAAISSLLAVTIGFVVGILCGYYRIVDAIVMRIVDGLLSFPSIILIISLVGVLGGGIPTLIIGLAITAVPPIVRIVRGQALSAKELTMVESARALGATDGIILRRYIAPEALSVAILQASVVLSNAVLAVSALSFLGIGLDPAIPSWGGMLSVAQQYFNPAWWMAIFPGIAITMTVLGLFLFGDAMRDVFDPRFGRQ